MVELQKRIDTLEGFYRATEGYAHLPAQSLIRYLISNYAVDLDLIQEFVRDLAREAGKPSEPHRPFAALAA
ncbi:hypothetical protein [Pannonibacter sp.]|uniref:hypothetical protein n=1 Tax=Pannonibacter sp. TaxID=1906786 RepID=UPI003F6FCC78